jgi:hypothetical protein
MTTDTTVAPSAAPAAMPDSFDPSSAARFLAQHKASLKASAAPPALGVVQGGRDAPALAPQQPQPDPQPAPQDPPPEPEAAQAEAEAEADGTDEGDDPSGMQFELGDGTKVTLADLLAARAKAAELEPKAAEAEQVRQQVEQERQALQRQAQEAHAAQQRYAQLAQQAEQRLGHYEQSLGLIGQTLDAREQQWRNLDWNAEAAKGPEHMAALMGQYQQHQQAQQALAAERQKLSAEQERSAQERVQQAVAVRERGLLEMFPHWSEPAKAQAELAPMVEAARARGFDPREVTETMDPRVFGLLADAAEGRRLRGELDRIRTALGGKLPGEGGQSQAAATPPRIKVVRPGAAAPRGDAAAIQRARADGALKTLETSGGNTITAAADALAEMRRVRALGSR